MFERKRTMKRIGILTAGGDTPALNATIYGAVERANSQGITVVGIMRGYAGLMDEKVAHVCLNPLYTSIPELNPCLGGTLIGSSRTYVDPKTDQIATVKQSLQRLQLDGLICIGGDGTINGMQPLADFVPCVLAPKTIDNDLGLNYLHEPNDWVRTEATTKCGYIEQLNCSRPHLDLEDIINYATPGYATAVFVVAQCVQRLRSTAESHRRIGIVEVMGRQSGYIALGAAYGQPDLILIPEVAVDIDQLEQRVRQIYELQRNVVIVVGEGVKTLDGKELGASTPSYDPAGNIRYSGAADALHEILAERIEGEFFTKIRTHETASSSIFTRKVGHTQRGGRPIQFDRFYAAQLGGKAVEMLVAGANNAVATLQYSPRAGFVVSSLSANKLRDQWGEIHARCVHSSMYDENRMQPSEFGEEYLKTIFTNAIGADDMEFMRAELFSPGNLSTRYQSMNTDMRKRIRYV
ncbi:6-phosphofructokinase [Fuerstiella marisgermanici]|uniref:6-phosphofructokinase n=2 Tax=Fuerstiella marisgermanici TaxID=1891926 RepID=A0A1P8WJE6_9PLAN|nr:6-phosphofructokinase [Fuerstiella marisgermanici]